MSKKIVLAGACRTAIGTMGGSLSTTPAAKLGTIVIKEALSRASLFYSIPRYYSKKTAIRSMLSFLYCFLGKIFLFPKCHV